MNATVYHCPNCGGGLVFSPEKQSFYCEYCTSIFIEQQLQSLTPKEAQPATFEQTSSQALPKDDDASIKDFLACAVMYQCPACGAEVITEETTAATFCCHCHNPVVLSDRLQGAFKPAQIIPFTVTRAQAEQAAKDWSKKRRWVGKSMATKASLGKMTGLYLPFWLADCNLHAQLQAKATRIRSWQEGKTRVTETKHYLVSRGARLTFEKLPVFAHSKIDRKMVNGIFPYDESKLQSFAMPYLSGFVAEKYDKSTTDVRPEVQTRLQECSEEMLQGTVRGYDGLRVENVSLDNLEIDWKYTLFPIWMMEYKMGGKRYLFAMNGQTSKVCAQAPVSIAKMVLLFFIAFSITEAAIVVVMMIMRMIGGL